MSKMKSPSSNQLMNEVKINVNMSRVSMKDRIGIHVESRLIITK